MGTEVAFCYLEEVHSPSANDSSETPQPLYHFYFGGMQVNTSSTFRYIHPSYCQRLFCLTHETAAIPVSSGRKHLSIA